MMQNLKRYLLVSSKLTWEIWRSLTRALKNFKNLHFNRLLFTKVYTFWAKESTGELFLMALKLDAKFVGNWLVLSKMTWRISQIFVHRLKNSNFILESKKAELNQNKTSKQPDWPNSTINKIFSHATESLFLRYKKISKKAVK